jgi:N-acetylglutamate synthase-like GNAT family acetyltransferase
MNFLMDCVAIRQCGSVRLCKLQCVAVRAAVCGSALGSVWQCARQCVAVGRGSARNYLCATVRTATSV